MVGIRGQDETLLSSASANKVYCVVVIDRARSR